MQVVVNSHIIRISGKAELEEGLTLGNDYELKVKGQVVKVEEHDNHDGTIDKIYVLKPELVEIC